MGTVQSTSFGVTGAVPPRQEGADQRQGRFCVPSSHGTRAIPGKDGVSPMDQDGSTNDPFLGRLGPFMELACSTSVCSLNSQSVDVAIRGWGLKPSRGAVKPPHLVSSQRERKGCRQTGHWMWWWSRRLTDRCPSLAALRVGPGAVKAEDMPTAPHCGHAIIQGQQTHGTGHGRVAGRPALEPFAAVGGQHV